jgi:MFS family permease
MSIVFLCPECHEENRVRNDLAGMDVRCPHCSVRVPVPREESRQDRHGGTALPWLPMQAFAASFLFGPLAGGVVTGINFSRLGKRFLLLPCALMGLVLFAVCFALVARFPELPRPAAMLINIGIGLLFLIMQRDTFVAWQEQKGFSGETRKAYKPGGLGQLLLIGLGCAAFQVGVIVLAVYRDLV